MTLRHLEDIEAQWPSCPTREARRLLWEQLAGPSGLWFSACRDIVQQRDTRTLALWLEQRDPIKQDILNFDASRGAMLRAYLRCTRLALVYGQKIQQNELDDRLHQLAEETGLAPGFLLELTWALLSHGPSLQPERAEELYVLLVEEGRDQGVIGLLSLHLLAHGTGDLYPHHELALIFRDQQFRQAEQEARAYVHSLGLWPEERDVCWQLTRPFDNRPVRRLTGASMGAAFALGLSKLCATTCSPYAAKLSALDLDKVAISATFESSGRLGKVAQTGPKILAVFDEIPREFLRLIVVSSDCEIPLAWQTHPFASPQVILADTYDEAVDRLHQAAGGADNGKTRRGSAYWTKAVALGLLTAFVGLAASVMPLGFALEERLGLEMLFRFRGVRPAPPEVVVVNVDRAVAERLDLPLVPETWPRSLHAQLTKQLSQAGAAAIAFDILFETARVPEEDQAFADAVRQARKVVLFSYLRSESVPLLGQDEAAAAILHREQLVHPMPPLAQAATAVAPFPLPEVPVNVSQYWTFKTAAGDKPTLPVVMFQLFTLDLYEAFRRLVEEVQPAQAAKLPQDREAILATIGVEAFMGMLRDLFTTGQLHAARLLQQLQQTTTPGADATREQTLLHSLIHLYQGGTSRYINFYGPPGTITTIPYDRVLRPQGAVAWHEQLDLRGKAVFVGFSEHAWPEKQDEFYTVFSQQDGSDLSGVEMAATAFANLLEDLPIRLCSGPVYLLVIGLWGGVMGVVCRLLPPVLAALSAGSLGILYALAAQNQFATAGTWYPLIIPLGMQSPLAFVGAILWRYVDTDRERQKIRRAIHYYLPGASVDQIATSVTDRSRSNRVAALRLPFRHRLRAGHISPDQAPPSTTDEAP